MLPPDAKPSNPQVEIDRLMALYRQGRYHEAAALGNDLVGRFPDSGSLHNFLGVVSAKLGDDQGAIASYRRALELQPGEPEFLCNLGNACYRLERFEEALRHFDQALITKPDFAAAHNSRGSALQANGCLIEAEQAYRHAIGINPDYAEAHNNLGNALREQGRLDEALESLQFAIDKSPEFAPARYNLACVLREMGHHGEAARAYGQALELNPRHLDALTGLGNTLNELGLHGQAIQTFRRALQLKPEHALAHDGLGTALSDAGRLEEAVVSYQAALAADPHQAPSWNNLGNVWFGLGRNQEAEGCYRKAVALDPEFAAAHNNLSQVHHYEVGDSHLAQICELMERTDLSDEQGMYLAFAMAKALDDLGEAEKAFPFFARANALQKALSGYDIQADEERFERIKRLADQAGQVTVPPDTRPGQPRPILIVGLPRSGTSLVEQILASHSKVHGAGELEWLGRQLGPAVNSPSLPLLDAGALVRFRNGYLDELAARGQGRVVVTDKMPGNFRWMGMLLTVLPDLKVVHLNRDPVATCWSMFRNHFAGSGNSFTCDLKDLADYYRLYSDLMNHWEERFPGRIYHLDYEELTMDQEGQTRALLDYCELEFEPDCLSFHRTRRAVLTLSGQQVRRALYTGSSQAWKAYQPYLAPLLGGLGRC